MELTIEQALQQGVAAHKEGKLQEAERCYRAILQSQPLHSDANHNLGVLAVSVNQAVAALPLFKAALEANPKTQQFWLSYIDALIKEKQFETAKQVIQQAKQQGIDGEQLNALKAQLVPIFETENANSSNPTQQQLNSLLEHYQTGRYGDAEKLAISLTQQFPEHQFSWKVLGALFRQTGRKSEALNANQKAVALSPQDTEAYNNLGTTLQELGRLEEAEASYKQAIAMKPDYAEAHSNLGATQQALGKLGESEASYTQAVTLKPDYADAHYNLGITLQALGRLEEAEVSYTQAIALKPDYAEAHYNLGATLQALGRLEEAEASYTQAVMLKPDYADAHYNLGITLQELGRLEESEASYTQAIALKLDYADAHYNLGVTLQALGRLEEAEVSYKQAISMKPDYADAHNNLGVTLKEMDRLEEAEASLRQAIVLKPDFAEAHSNLGATLQELGRLEEAEANYTQAIVLKPDYVEAKTNLAHLMHKKGELKKGFELMEYRIQNKELIVSAPRDNLRCHPEDDLQGKHFVVYEEQGLGDIVQFCRYLPLLEQRGARVSFKVAPKLHRLLATLESQITLIEALPAEEEVDFEAPLLSLPHLLGTTLTNIPAPIPYLYADDANIKTWSKVLSKKAFKIGICWQGSSTSKVDHGRSFSLSLFAGIAQISGVELISLHKGDGEKQLANIDFPVTTLGSNFDTGNDAFVDTAAVMTLCDLIITSDTSIAHLAGAMGCQTWVALQYSPDWRWMLNRTDSPWYRTMTLYRQHHSGDWQGVFAALEHDVCAQLNPKESFYD